MKINYKGYMREKIQRNPVTISPDASFFEARALIHEKGVRHLPVVDKNGNLVGIVTKGDIQEAGPSDATSLRRSGLTIMADAILLYSRSNFCRNFCASTSHAEANHLILRSLQ